MKHAPSVMVPGNKEGVIRYLEDEEDCNLDIESFRTPQDLVRKLSDRELEWVASDDYLPNLRLLAKLQGKLRVKTSAYCGVFFGLRALSGAGFAQESGRMISVASSLLPWRIITWEYRQLLQRVTCRVAMSRYADTMLSELYGVTAHGIVSPILAPAFRSYDLSAGIMRDSAVFYSGNLNESGAAERFLKDHLEVCDRYGLKPLVLGSPPRHLSRNVATIVRGCSDSELAQLYARASWVFTPQPWEAFGYVGPEALSCGSEAVLVRYQPWIEALGQDYVPPIIGASRGALSRWYNSQTPSTERSLARFRRAELIRKAFGPEESAQKFLAYLQSAV